MYERMSSRGSFYVQIIAWLVAFPLEERCLLWGLYFYLAWNIYRAISGCYSPIPNCRIIAVYFECVLQVQYLTHGKHRLNITNRDSKQKRPLYDWRFKQNMKTNTCFVRSDHTPSLIIRYKKKRKRKTPCQKTYVIIISETCNVLDNQFRFHPKRCV